MDPNQTLAELRKLARDTDRLDLEDARRAVELAADLDDWLSKGGMLPAAWQQGRR